MKRNTYTFPIEHETTGKPLGEIKVQADFYSEAEGKFFAYLDSNAPHAIYTGNYTRVENDQYVGVVELE